MRVQSQAAFGTGALRRLVQCLLLAVAVAPARGAAQSPTPPVEVGSIIGADIRRNANGVLGMLAYSAMPGAAVTSIRITQPATGNPGLIIGQIGSGFTASESFPVYLEGYIGYARYDPKFVFSDGTDSRTLPTRWDDVAGTAGVGWDFKLTDHWVLRPIATLTLGYVASDARVFGILLDRKTGVDLTFLKQGAMSAIGVGGSLVLAYYIKKPDYEYDLELRTTDIEMTTFGSTSPPLRGRTHVTAANVWTRLRWPTGAEVYDRPLRYVVDLQHSFYQGDTAAALGVSQLTSVGAGLEIDTGAREFGAFGLYVQRLRLVLRYSFGPNVSGWSVGFAASF